MQLQERNELMEKALRETFTYGQELLEACPKISSSFLQGNSDQGIQMLGQFLEGMGWISQALHVTHSVQAERNLSINLSELPEILEPLVEALENKDYGLIGDILTYEIQPVLSRWSQELERGLNQTAA